jgi:glycosyltransferase involved in cell wall biosynthesis
LAGLYAQVRVAACSIVTGAGTRVKIIEAAAHGKAIVSTFLGAEGLEFEDGVEIALHDRPQRFAEACIALLNDEDFALRLGRAAHQKAQRLYSRQAAIRTIGAALDAAGLHSARV